LPGRRPPRGSTVKVFSAKKGPPAEAKPTGSATISVRCDVIARNTDGPCSRKPASCLQRRAFGFAPKDFSKRSLISRELE
jgi:hypothetical protein